MPFGPDAPAPASTQSGKTQAKSGLVPGLQILLQQPPQAQIVVIGAVLTFTLQVTNVVEVYLVRDAYDATATATVFGLVTMAWAGGQIAGSGIAGRLLAERSTARPALLLVIAVAAALLAIAAFDSLPGLP